MLTTALLTLIALTSCSISPGTEAPFRELTFDQALAAAKKDQKVVMVDFFTTWCGPCKKLDKVTWKDPDVQAWIGKSTVALKIDAEKEVDLARRFKIEAYPTILFVKADGTEIDRMIGFKAPQSFIQEATSALAGKDAIARVKAQMAGHANGPSERAKLGKALAQRGKHGEALAEYLWCFDHGLEVDKSYSGVRLSFLLSDIVVLGSQYPPAIEALEQRRDAAEKVLDSGKGGFQAAADFAGLNQYLRSPERTLALYDRLKQANQLTPEVKNGMFRNLIDSLLAARRYADLIEGTGDVERTVTSVIAGYDEQKRRLEDQAGEEPGGTDYMKQNVVHRVGKYYEALLGAEQPKTAAAVADRLIAFDAGPETYVVLIEHAIRAGADDAARGLVERGQKTLSEKEQERLELAAKKIPEKK